MYNYPNASSSKDPDVIEVVPFTIPDLNDLGDPDELALFVAFSIPPFKQYTGNEQPECTQGELEDAISWLKGFGY